MATSFLPTGSSSGNDHCFHDGALDFPVRPVQGTDGMQLTLHLTSRSIIYPFLTWSVLDPSALGLSGGFSPSENEHREVGSSNGKLPAGNQELGGEGVLFPF